MDFSTYEGCLAAVQQDGMAIQYVPKPMRTLELCLSAVQRDGCTILYVPDEKRTHEIILASLQSYSYAPLFVPPHMRTPEICLAAVQKCGYMLNYVPEHFQSDEIIQAAITQDPNAVEYIKKKNTIVHAEQKKMPEKAYDTLEMGYDEDSAIVDGELMVDFHNEFEYGRYYRKATFEKFVLPSKLNPTTREAITEYTIYQAKV